MVSQSVLERLKAIFSGVEPLPPGRIPPTVGLNIGRIRVQRQQLLFWDLGGGGSLRALWTKYERQTADAARRTHPNAVSLAMLCPQIL